MGFLFLFELLIFGLFFKVLDDCKFWEEPTPSSEGEFWKLGDPQREIWKFPL